MLQHFTHLHTMQGTDWNIRAELIQVDPRYCVLSLGFGAFPYVALASKVALAHIAHGERRSNLGVS